MLVLLLLMPHSRPHGVVDEASLTDSAPHVCCWPVCQQTCKLYNITCVSWQRTEQHHQWNGGRRLTLSQLGEPAKRAIESRGLATATAARIVVPVENFHGIQQCAARFSQPVQEFVLSFNHENSFPHTYLNFIHHILIRIFTHFGCTGKKSNWNRKIFTNGPPAGKQYKWVVGKLGSGKVCFGEKYVAAVELSAKSHFFFPSFLLLANHHTCAPPLLTPRSPFHYFCESSLCTTRQPATVVVVMVDIVTASSSWSN